MVKRALFAARDRSPRPAASAHFRSHDVSSRHSGGHGCLRVRVKRLKPSHTPSALQLLLLGLRGRSCRVNSSFVHALRGSHQHNPTLRDAIAAHEVQPTSAFEALIVAALERSSFVETQYSIGPSRAATLEVPETAYGRAQLVGCQPIVCSTAAMPDPIVDFDDEFLRQIGERRATYALTGRRLANFF